MSFLTRVFIIFSVGVGSVHGALNPVYSLNHYDEVRDRFVLPEKKPAKAPLRPHILRHARMFSSLPTTLGDIHFDHNWGYPFGDTIHLHKQILLLPAEDGALLRQGTAQRARALYAFAQDILLGGKLILKKGIIPALLIEHILQETQNLSLTSARQIWRGKSTSSLRFLYGPDIVRKPDGTFAVIEDNMGNIGGIADVVYAHRAHVQYYSMTQDSIRRSIHDPYKDFKTLVKNFYESLPPEHRKQLTAWVPEVGYQPLNSGGFPAEDLEDLRTALLLQDLGISSINPEITFAPPTNHRQQLSLFSESEHSDPPQLSKQLFDYLYIKNSAFLNFVPLHSNRKKFAHKPFWVLFKNRKAEFLNPPVVTDLLSHKALLPYVDAMISFYLKENPIFQNPRSEIFMPRLLDDSLNLERVTTAEVLATLHRLYEEKGQPFVVKRGDSAQGHDVYFFPPRNLANEWLIAARIAHNYNEHLTKRSSPQIRPLYVVQNYIPPSVYGNYIINFRMITGVYGGKLTYVSRVPYTRGSHIAGAGKTNMSQKDHDHVLQIVTMVLKEQSSCVSALRP